MWLVSSVVTSKVLCGFSCHLSYLLSWLSFLWECQERYLLHAKSFRILLEHDRSLLAGGPSFRAIHSALQRKEFHKRHWLDKLELGLWCKWMQHSGEIWLANLSWYTMSLQPVLISLKIKQIALRAWQLSSVSLGLLTGLLLLEVSAGKVCLERAVMESSVTRCNWYLSRS